MERITKAILERKVDYLNRVTDSPETPWTRNADGKLKANIGNYHLSGAYGGWTLHHMCNDGGGVHSVLNCGYVPKRDLASLIDAYVYGIQAAA